MSHNVFKTTLVGETENRIEQYEICLCFVCHCPGGTWSMKQGRDGNLIQYWNRNPIQIQFSQGSELSSESEKRGIREV